MCEREMISLCRNGQLAGFLPEFENWGRAVALIVTGILV